jgi:hypothetical protein
MGAGSIGTPMRICGRISGIMPGECDYEIRKWIARKNERVCRIFRDKGLMTAPEVAKRLGISPFVLSQRLARGKIVLKCVWLYRIRAFKQEDVNRYIVNMSGTACENG